MRTDASRAARASARRAEARRRRRVAAVLLVAAAVATLCVVLGRWVVPPRPAFPVAFP